MKKYIDVTFHFRAFSASINDIRCSLLNRLNQRPAAATTSTAIRLPSKMPIRYPRMRLAHALCWSRLWWEVGGLRFWQILQRSKISDSDSAGVEKTSAKGNFEQNIGYYHRYGNNAAASTRIYTNWKCGHAFRIWSRLKRLT